MRKTSGSGAGGEVGHPLSLFTTDDRGAEGSKFVQRQKQNEGATWKAFLCSLRCAVGACSYEWWPVCTQEPNDLFTKVLQFDKR